MAYLIAAAVIAICGAVMVSPMFFASTKVKRYKGVSKAAFLSTLAAEGVPEGISSAVFDFYKSKAHWQSFEPAPEMDINSVFDEGLEDIDDTAIDLLRVLHLQPPSELDRREWSGTGVRTAGDLARWLHWASKHQPV